MSLEALYDKFREAGLPGLRTAGFENSLDHFYAAILAFSAGDFTRASDFARTAARREPDNLVYGAAESYLSRVRQSGKHGVYMTGDAFANFIRGGGNVGLYARTSLSLQTIYQEYTSLRLLDVGVGDGLALLPALAGPIQSLDLVEPSGPMLARTVAALAERGITANAFEGTLQAFIASHEQLTWDLVEATFSLQSITPGERPGVLKWLHEHGHRI